MATSKVVVRVTLHDSSLLEVTLTMYVALMETLRVSVQVLLASGDAPRTIALWDDGLDKIR